MRMPIMAAATPSARLLRLAAMSGCMSLAVNGCATPHLYPVCFYNRAPTQQRVQTYWKPRLIEALAIATGQERNRTQIGLSPDVRWLVVNVTAHQDKEIAKVWPRVGCIGDAMDSQGTKQEADCARYAAYVIATRNYVAIGNAKDVGGFDIWNESPVPNTLVRCHRVQEDEMAPK